MMASMSDGFEEDADANDEKDIFFVQQEARLDFIKSQAKKSTIGPVINDAMGAVEKINVTCVSGIAR